MQLTLEAPVVSSQWQLLMEKAQQYCIGRDGMMTFTQNTSALQVNRLYNICSHR